MIYIGNTQSVSVSVLFSPVIPISYQFTSVTSVGACYYMCCQIHVISVYVYTCYIDQEICPSYWPTEVNDSAAYGKLKVKLISEELESDLTIRKFEIGADSPYLVPVSARICMLNNLLFCFSTCSSLCVYVTRGMCMLNGRALCHSHTL